MPCCLIDVSVLPVAVVIDFFGATRTDYERLVAELQLSRRDPAPGGRVFHWVKEYPDGFRVIEVWRQRRLFDAQLANDVRPLLGHVGLPEPYLSYHEVPNDLMLGEE